MGWKKTLFDQDAAEDDYADNSEVNSSNMITEAIPLDRLKNLEEKITAAVEKVKALKEEKNLLDKKIKTIEALLDEKDQEIQVLRSDKVSIGSQLEELLDELETVEL